LKLLPAVSREGTCSIKYRKKAWTKGSTLSEYVEANPGSTAISVTNGSTCTAVPEYSEAKMPQNLLCQVHTTGETSRQETRALCPAPIVFSPSPQIGLCSLPRESLKMPYLNGKTRIDGRTSLASSETRVALQGRAGNAR